MLFCFMDNQTLILLPLRKPLENRATVLRCVRFLNLSINERQFAYICLNVFNHYNKIMNGDVSGLKKVNQRLRGGHPKKVVLYPSEFIQEMIKNINETYLFLTKVEKPKRKRIIKKVTTL